MIRAETVLMTEQCNFHKTEFNAITFSVIIISLSFSEETDSVLRANWTTLFESIRLVVENIDLKIIYYWTHIMSDNLYKCYNSIDWIAVLKNRNIDVNFS